MTLTDSLILALIVLLLGYAIYDELIMPRRYGPTRLRVPLRRRARLDRTTNCSVARVGR